MKNQDNYLLRRAQLLYTCGLFADALELLSDVMRLAPTADERTYVAQCAEVVLMDGLSVADDKWVDMVMAAGMTALFLPDPLDFVRRAKQAAQHTLSHWSN